MNKPIVNLPTDQATWTRADVERYLADRGPEAVFGTDTLKAWATKSGLHPAGSVVGHVRVPASVMPELAAVADPKNDTRDMASVYVDPNTATAYATDGKVAMRVAVNDERVGQKVMAMGAVETMIPLADDRLAIRFDAHVLLRLCISALASVGGQPYKSGRAAAVTLYVNPKDANDKVRVEVTNVNCGELRMIGVAMPMDISRGYETVDPLRLKDVSVGVDAGVSDGVDAVGPTADNTQQPTA